MTTASELTSEKKIKESALLAACSEMLFVILPFIVIAITLGYKGEIRKIFLIPEWSIISSVIAGQSVVKLASVGIGWSDGAKKDRLVMAISLLVVGLLVPVLIFLAIVLTADKVSSTFGWVQAAAFILSGCAYFSVIYLEKEVSLRFAKSSVLGRV